MGKVLSFALALADLGLLALLVFAPSRDLPRDAGLALGFVAVAVIAWVVAFGTALYRAVLLGVSFKSVMTLLAFFWLPALPALCYGLSGAGSAFQRRSHRTVARPATIAAPAVRTRFTLPPVDKRLTVSRSRGRGAAA